MAPAAADGDYKCSVAMISGVGLEPDDSGRTGAEVVCALVSRLGTDVSASSRGEDVEVTLCLRLGKGGDDAPKVFWRNGRQRKCWGTIRRCFLLINPKYMYGYAWYFVIF